VPAGPGEVIRRAVHVHLDAVDGLVRVDHLQVAEGAQARVAVRADERLRLRLGVGGGAQLGERELAAAHEVERAPAMELEVLVVERVGRQAEDEPHEDEAGGARHLAVIGTPPPALEPWISSCDAWN
jgi:hypothetical protein